MNRKKEFISRINLSLRGYGIVRSQFPLADPKGVHSSTATKTPAANTKNSENAGNFPIFCDCRFAGLPMLDIRAMVTMHGVTATCYESLGQKFANRKTPSAVYSYITGTDNDR